jgi:hypothetical protein
MKFVHNAFIPGLKNISEFEFDNCKEIFIMDDRQHPFNWTGISVNQAKLRYVMIGNFIMEMMHCPELQGTRPIYIDSSLLNHPQGFAKASTDETVPVTDFFRNGATSSVSSNLWQSKKTFAPPTAPKSGGTGRLAVGGRVRGGGGGMFPRNSWGS